MTAKTSKIILILVDVVLAAYIIVAFSAFNKPEEKTSFCRGVEVTVVDATAHGFISSNEVVARLKKLGLDPKGMLMKEVDCRRIEEALLKTPFVRTAQCYKDISGMVNIEISQRLPVVRIKAINNDDFYIDDKDCVMPNSDYTSDLIIATGYISRGYATRYVSPLARNLMDDDFCRNLFQQINITQKLEVELVPRLGNHVVFLGKLPESDRPSERQQLIHDFVEKKMSRLKAFYKYGLPKAGWNVYSEISLEFDNQIICKRHDKEAV